MFGLVTEANPSSHSHVSPRTDSEPMAFTGSEFMRGAIYAWLWFLVLSTTAHVPVVGYLTLFVLFSTVPWSFGALLVGGGFAYGLGRALICRRSLVLHACLFALLGACVGLVTTAVAMHSPTSGLAQSPTYSIVTVCIAATIAVPLGWWQTVRRALHRDRVRPSDSPHLRPAQPRRDGTFGHVLNDENPQMVNPTAPVASRTQRPNLETFLWLLIPVVLLVAHVAQIFMNFSLVGCEGACDLDLSLGALTAYPWQVAGSLTVALALAITLRWSRRASYWAPLVGVVLVLCSVTLTSILFHIGLAGMYERNAQIEQGNIPPAPPPPDPTGAWGAGTPGAPYLHFGSDGTLVGYDGCNDLSGQWAQDEDGEITLDARPLGTNVCDGVDTWLSLGRAATIIDDFLYVRGEVGSSIGGLQPTR